MTLVLAEVPLYWYFVAAVVVATPLYFLFTRPRKKDLKSKWRG